jgi:hypothetical protein
MHLLLMSDSSLKEGIKKSEQRVNFSNNHARQIRRFFVLFWCVILSKRKKIGD